MHEGTSEDECGEMSRKKNYISDASMKRHLEFPTPDVGMMHIKSKNSRYA